jgi:hypothetical protein
VQRRICYLPIDDVPHENPPIPPDQAGFIRTPRYNPLKPATM